MQKLILTIIVVVWFALLVPAYGNGTSNVPANRRPLPKGTIDTVKIGRDTVIVDVLGKFSDADGDTLYFSAATADTNVTTVGVEGSKVIISPNRVFRASVAVTAADWCGRSATQMMPVKFSRAPMTVGSIDPVTIGRDSATLDVWDKFSDVDSDT